MHVPTVRSLHDWPNSHPGELLMDDEGSFWRYYPEDDEELIQPAFIGPSTPDGWSEHGPMPKWADVVATLTF